ncbi:MAG: iron-only hydrogenase system regulator [Ruminococcaceae bacterium]|nr:iron-only hydrogenase system regulator [Oscillospiraceae bacterium]
MENRVALIGIVVENPESVEKLNGILHQFGNYIIGRMGIPYPKKGVSIISIAIDAPMDIISSLSGKLGMLKGVSSKTVYSNV